MKISICIPCFKQSEYLPEAIDSVLAQTYEDIEIIIVNDGSPDSTEEIATKYQFAHPFKIKVVNQVNKGLASARNTGIMCSEGKFILPLDADDILLDTCVEVLVKVAKNSSADIIAPSFRTFGLSQETVYLNPRPTLEDFKTANRIGYFSMIKKSALLECGGYSPRMVEGYEDYHLWHDLLSRGKSIATVHEPLVFYRTKEKSMYTEATGHHVKLMAQIKKDFPKVYA